MSKANQSLTSREDVRPSGPQSKHSIAPRMPVVFGFLFFVCMFVVGGATAEINTTSILEAIQAFVDIMPSITDMITTVVPAIMTLAIVGFVLKFFNQIIEMIGSVLKF